MKGRISIRDFRAGDAEKLLECREEAARMSFPGMRMDREKSRKSIMLHLKKHPGTIKVAETKGSAIGFIEFKLKSCSFGRYGYINLIFVEEKHRKHGVGKVLLDSAEKWFLSRCIRSIQATVTNTNNESLDFFREHGFLPRRVIVEKRI
jgi:ribosomal protein S18 acetylase RimI-like enzyme